MNRVTRQIIFWTHLCLGVAAGAAIMIMSATGVLLAFERQILQVVDRDLRTVDVPSDPRRCSLSEMLATVSASAGSMPSSIVVRPAPSGSVEFTFGRDRTIYVDPYTGAVLGESSASARAFFAVVERWHRTLGEPIGERGALRSIGAAANAVLLLLAASGAYLWIPRVWTWTAVRAALLFRPGLKARARDWNWHNVAGVWSALPLVLITFTGVIMSYPWANALLFRMAGSAPPQARQQGGRPGEGRGAGPAAFSGVPISADLDGAVAMAGARITGWQTMSLRVPRAGEDAVAVTVDTGSGGEVEKRSDLLVDTTTGRIVRTTRFADASLAQRLRALIRFVHTGEEGGIPGELVAALASAGAMLLVWSGTSLAVRRLWSSRRVRRCVGSEVLGPAA